MRKKAGPPFGDVVGTLMSRKLKAGGYPLDLFARIESYGTLAFPRTFYDHGRNSPKPCDRSETPGTSRVTDFDVFHVLFESNNLGRIDFDRLRLDAWCEVRQGAKLDHMTGHRSGHFQLPAHLQAAQARHVRTRPYTARTNGKAERFIQTS